MKSKSIFSILIGLAFFCPLCLWWCAYTEQQAKQEDIKVLAERGIDDDVCHDVFVMTKRTLQNNRERLLEHFPDQDIKLDIKTEYLCLDKFSVIVATRLSLRYFEPEIDRFVCLEATLNVLGMLKNGSLETDVSELTILSMDICDDEQK